MHRGTVLSPDGTRCPRATVTVYQGFLRLARTEVQAGQFELEVPAGEFEDGPKVLVVTDARQDDGSPLAAGRSETELPDGEVSIRLPPGFWVRGRAVDANGRPIPGLDLDVVSLVRRDEGAGMGIASSHPVTTDEHGTFSVTGLTGDGWAVLAPKRPFVLLDTVWMRERSFDVEATVRVERRVAPPPPA